MRFKDYLIEANIKLDPAVFTDEMFYYISGEGDDDNIDPAWVNLLLKQRAQGPNTLYRLVVIPLDSTIKVGDTLKLEEKPIMSASDHVDNAVYAGCNYQFSHGGSLKNKMLVVVEIKNPTILVNYDQIYKFADEELDFGFSALAKAEREYIIDGSNVSGTVVHFTTDVGYISRGDFKMLNKTSTDEDDWF